MLPQHSAHPLGAKTNRAKSVMQLSEKIKMLDELLAGMSAAAVPHEEESIPKNVHASAPESAKVPLQVHEEGIEEMERWLGL